MRILGLTGLVKIESEEEWEKVKAALLAHGYEEVQKTGKCPYLRKNGKIVTDKNRNGNLPRYVELEALTQSGIEP